MERTGGTDAAIFFEIFFRRRGETMESNTSCIGIFGASAN